MRWRGTSGDPFDRVGEGAWKGSVLAACVPVRQSGVRGVGFPKTPGRRSGRFGTHGPTRGKEAPRTVLVERFPRKGVAMAFKTGVLVLANQKAGPEGLTAAVRRRAGRGDVTFRLIVPAGRGG